MSSFNNFENCNLNKEKKRKQQIKFNMIPDTAFKDFWNNNFHWCLISQISITSFVIEEFLLCDTGKCTRSKHHESVSTQSQYTDQYSKILSEYTETN